MSSLGSSLSSARRQHLLRDAFADASAPPHGSRRWNQGNLLLDWRPRLTEPERRVRRPLPAVSRSIAQLSTLLYGVNIVQLHDADRYSDSFAREEDAASCRASELTKMLLKLSELASYMGVHRPGKDGFVLCMLT